MSVVLIKNDDDDDDDDDVIYAVMCNIGATEIN